ncbi:MAG TPA: nucleotide exchange factor GrpE, partial [Pseudothermotoga sp.]
VYNALIDATKKEGLEVIPAVGEPFDPNVHQAVMQESDSEKESGIVLKELQKGYKLKDRVLRPSMVSVNE